MKDPGEVASVRLVEWNVAMSLYSKAHLLAELQPTVAILPESAHPDRSGDVLRSVGATSMQWIGAHSNKGLLVVAFNGWTLRIDASYDPGYQWVMPLHLDGPRQIRMLAVWDMNHRGHGHESARRLGACRASIEHYEGFLSGTSDLTIISGDFNNSVYWDKPNGATKFGDFMDQLQSRGLVSAYHVHHGCARGAEPHPTLWWTRSVNKPYHVDYTFVSPPAAIQAVIMGSHTDWLSYSDHSPMTVDLQVVPQHESSAIVTDVGVGAHGNGGPTGSGQLPPQEEKRMIRTHHQRFELENGSLPDMTCGGNGETLVQDFRPTYFTADWADGVLVQAQVWGPRVLQDGSLGKRELDYQWKQTRATGPVKYTDLPTEVANRLLSYNTENGFKILPEQL